MKRARELEEAGVATRAARAAAEAGLGAEDVISAKRAAAEGDAIAAMSRPLKAGKPSKVKYNERRSLATAGAPAGTRREVSTVDVTTTTSAAAATGTKKKRQGRKDRGSADNRARRRKQTGEYHAGARGR